MASSGNNGNMSHDEMWDDSVLIDSWNEALAEYKMYHSIHLKKGNVAELLHESEEALSEGGDGVVPSDPAGIAPPLQNGDAEAVSTEQSPARQDPAVAEAPMAPPQVMLGSVRDEGLKKLLMSWYYAGYYTGLYEGQQQAQQQQGEGQQK